MGETGGQTDHRHVVGADLEVEVPGFLGSNFFAISGVNGGGSLPDPVNGLDTHFTTGVRSFNSGTRTAVPLLPPFYKLAFIMKL